MCIPIKFLLDNNFDCDDESDEEKKYAGKYEFINGRDRYFRHKILHSTLSTSNLNYDYKPERLYYRFRNGCLSIFEFEDSRNLLYSLVRFLYDPKATNSLT
ncbi:hypothetical protein I4U23_027585 [Adineta vaga]|nr:hypothetical protein I4U23_027585 [Adineta vaga]